jgi:glycosyltransferase involved in cell wall biosynthesis
MFKNEASVIRRMLDSCLPYIDYYVFQDNGSTDGTDQIVKDFLFENKLSGELYVCEEGWQGFGWNRDHLIKYCQNIDHGCDWIIKMDCDEVLQVDESFDWSVFDDTTIHSFHVAAKANGGTCMYYRAWIWNAKMKWAFQHDPCHETIYCQDPNIGSKFDVYNLPRTFVQIGFDQGQSWSNPLKFVSDSLILENKLISNNEMISDQYHFWYIAKSYYDSQACNVLPLGLEHKKELARRSLFYFDQYINMYSNSSENNEMCYISCILMADLYKFLGYTDAAISIYQKAEKYFACRNEHLIGLTEIYRSNHNYIKMLECTTIMIQPERTNPFPDKCCVFIDDNSYYNTGNYIAQLHNEAISLFESNNINKQSSIFSLKPATKRFFIIDNVYENPDAVRDFALGLEYNEDLRFYKGLRSKESYRTDGLKQLFENIIGEKITNWNEHGFNGGFQVTTAKDPQVYHYDEQKWAAMIYLTPDAPIESGTRLHQSKLNGTRHRSDQFADSAFNGNFYDSTKFDIADVAGNIYNRLIIMDAGCFHSAGPYFGDNLNNGRLIQLFFFD